MEIEEKQFKCKVFGNTIELEKYINKNHIKREDIQLLTVHNDLTVILAFWS